MTENNNGDAGRPQNPSNDKRDRKKFPHANAKNKQRNGQQNEKQRFPQKNNDNVAKQNWTPQNKDNRPKQSGDLPDRRFRNIILIGMPGSGKSSIGKTYAYHTKRKFVDLDRQVENYFGKPIPKIFAEDGEDAFRQAETKCLKKISRYYNCVIALGGGTLIDTNNLQIIRQMGFVVYLEAPAHVLAARVFHENATKTRPLFADLKTENEFQEKLTQILHDREGTYLQADQTVKTGFSSVDAAALELLSLESKAFHREYQRLVAAVGNQPPLLVFPQGHHWMVKRFAPKKENDNTPIQNDQTSEKAEVVQS